LPEPVIGKLQREAREHLDHHLSTEQRAVLAALASAKTHPARFKQPFILQGLADPWSGLITLERHGHRLAELARSGVANLPALIAVLEAGMGRNAEAVTPIRIPAAEQPAEHVAYLVGTLDEAYGLRQKALRNLSPDERRFLFEHSFFMVEEFSPSVSEQPTLQAEADLRFIELTAERMDYAALVAAAQVVARLGDDRWLQQVPAAFHRPQHAVQAVSGVTGEVWLVHEMPAGLIVVGGPGPNVYDLDQRIALVLDLGGDDTYRGAIAAPADPEHGISVVIDLAGNDTYRASPLGLATGRLGIGLLIDRGGNDTYELSAGAGGTGFAGLGVLYDRSGDDRYVGSRFTQGAAVGGLGLLLDGGGNDTYTSFGYALGFGGPWGVGALIDVAGDDEYRCGRRYPSSYNATDAPDAQPGDERFQYDAFGMGVGSGKRIFTKEAERVSYALAGGWGLLLDLSGNDRYQSSNFSQGAGYFFGVGLKLDFGGDDEHAAARFGHAAGAHSGAGLHVDYRGEDRYVSSGPFYNGATAWDLSMMLCIDAGQGNDLYDLRRSDGLGVADHHSWSVFLDEGGRDRYLVPRGMGSASDASMAAFFDLAGEDEYEMAGRGNGRTVLDQAGGLFIDR